jgi:hypothetical protein
VFCFFTRNLVEVGLNSINMDEKTHSPAVNNLDDHDASISAGDTNPHFQDASPPNEKAVNLDLQTKIRVCI